MQKIIIASTILLCTVFINPALAKKRPKSNHKSNQKKDTAQEKDMSANSMWERRKKAMKPTQLKDLVEENHRLKTRNLKLEKETKLTQEEIDKLMKLKLRLQALRKKALPTPTQEEGNLDLAAEADESWMEEEDLGLEGLYKFHKEGMHQEGQDLLHIDGLTRDDWGTDQNGQLYIKGIIFKVQMGAYRKRDLAHLTEERSAQEAFGQEQIEGINMYTLRHFRDYWKADAFKKELRAMGLKDAWIVAFKEGQRVPLKEVLQEVTHKKKTRQ